MFHFSSPGISNFRIIVPKFVSITINIDFNNCVINVKFISERSQRSVFLAVPQSCSAKSLFWHIRKVLRVIFVKDSIFSRYCINLEPY